MYSSSAYRKAKYNLALELWRCGVVLTAESNHPLVVEREGPNGVERGFKLHLHQKNPMAPLSPLYFNLREPPKGPLTPEVIGHAAACMRHLQLENGLLPTPDSDPHHPRIAIVGVPEAGNPFARALKQLSGDETPLIKLFKYEYGNKRCIASLSEPIPPSVQKVLLVDDVIVEGGSKFEAIRNLRDAGLEVADVIVLIDREQGGHYELKEWGCNLHAVFTMTELLDFWVKGGEVESRVREDVRSYLKAA